ncbi:MAG: ABC transporter substrate-binding protein [Clostridia bacterium]|nr:ABC transporter substrate-binding protein [Clostridia bacterium]
MLNFKKIISLILSVLLIICCFTGCSDKYKEAYIYFELLEKPKTVDPQTAYNDSELLVVRNIYEGLLRKDEHDEIGLGAAADYTYKGLTYTFDLRDDLVWSDGTPLTADDFVYGFRRAVDPKIKAPFANRLKNIQGAEAIINGSADVSTLAVKAVDDTTLTITMCREDVNFLETLTTSVCMPCNQEFFENSIGKYGLDAENTISNGSYRLSKWNKEDFGIRLYKNEEYNGYFKAENAAVFISCVDDESQAIRLKDGDCDIAFIPCDELDKIDNTLTNVGINNICWFMTISREYSPQVRGALLSAFSGDVYGSALPSGFSVAKSIYPEIIAADTDNIGFTKYDLDAAKTEMSAQVAGMEDKKFPQATMYYYNTENVEKIATAVLGHWQKNLSTFVNIKDSDNLSALQSEIATSTLDFSLFPITAKSDLFSEYASNFAAVSTATTPETLQQELLKDLTIVPVAYQSTNISYISSLENVVMSDDNGYIDFSFIVKQ